MSVERVVAARQRDETTRDGEPELRIRPRAKALQGGEQIADWFPPRDAAILLDGT